MKHSTFIIGFSLFFFSFFNDAVNENKISDKKASSILYLTNNTTSTSITKITITYTNWWHNPNPVVINTYIPPNGGSQTFNFGNLSEYVTIKLTFSTPTTGSIQDTQADPYNCPWMACTHFSSSIEESVYFYFYGVNYMFLMNSGVCFC